MTAPATRLTIELEPAVSAGLEARAARKGTTPAELAAAAIAELVADSSAVPRSWALDGQPANLHAAAPGDAAAKEVSREKRRPGAMKGRIRMAPDFDDTPPEILEAIERGIEPSS